MKRFRAVIQSDDDGQTHRVKERTLRGRQTRKNFRQVRSDSIPTAQRNGDSTSPPVYTKLLPPIQAALPLESLPVNLELEPKPVTLQQLEQARLLRERILARPPRRSVHNKLDAVRQQDFRRHPATHQRLSKLISQMALNG